MDRGTSIPTRRPAGGTTPPEDSARAGGRGALPNALRAAFLLTIFSLGFMQPSLAVSGLKAAPTDLVFLPLALLWAAALLAGRVRARREPGYLAVLLYVGALGVSLAVSPEPVGGAVKLATQVYLAALAFLACSLVETRDDLRRAILAWLAATAAIALVCLVTLALFYAEPQAPLLRRFLRRTIFIFGTLPPGHYPRVRLTFLNANMLCNYLTVSLMLLLLAARLGWVKGVAFALLLGGIALSAALTLSPGLAGILLAAGLWLRFAAQGRGAARARLALAAGIPAAIVALPIMAVTPILHPTAPYLIHPPGTGLTLAPSGRLLTWTAAAREFLAHPLLGHGLGVEAVRVDYRAPYGELQHLTDAHNTYLNVAAQAGLAGLAGMLFLLVGVARRARPFRLLQGDSNALRLALGTAFLVAFAYEGLGGSYEDSRHLWVLLGLFLAAVRIEGDSPPGGITAARAP